jgi:hypothetical protein
VRAHCRPAEAALPRSVGRAVPLCAGALALLALAAAVGPSDAGAAKRKADPLSLGAVAPRPAAGPVRDRVIHGEPGTLRLASAAASTGVYQDQDGHSVRVQVSDAYADPDIRAQELVNFLGTLLHTDEMNQLTASLVTPRELRRVCGRGALACYFPDPEEIVVSAEDGGPNDPPREFLIAHEYGHHLAANRSNSPWTALERGTKRWSTHEDICRGIKRRKIRPGFYFENPGEAFAESFAFYHFPNVIKWIWDIPRPDQGSYDAILADVRFPWTRRTASGWSGRLGKEHRKEIRRLETPLDGRLKVKLDGPPGADFDLAVLGPNRGRVLQRAVHPGPDETLRYTVCGNRSVRVVVHRFKGAGEFEVTTARP